MSDVKFDPVTGKPITNEQNSGYKFDPMTGKPINPQPAATEGPRFDPMTGKPLDKPKNDGPKFDPFTGKPIDPNSVQTSQPTYGSQPVNNAATGAQSTYGAQNAYGAQNTFGAQNSYGAQNPYGSQNSYGSQSVNGTYGYDPVAIEKEQNSQNKKVALIVLVLVIVAFIGLAIFGVVKATKLIKNSVSNNQSELTTDNDVVNNTPTDNEPVVEVPAQPAEEPVQEQPVEEPVQEQPVEKPAEEPVQEQPAEEPAQEQPANTVASSPADIDANDLFTFAIGDKYYHVPMKVSALLDEGWTFDTNTDATRKLGAGDKDYVYLICPLGETSSISVDVKNFSMNAQEIKDCYITTITLYDNDVKKLGKDISIHSGLLKIGSSTEDEVKSILGEPNDVYDSSVSHAYYYYKDNGDDSDTKISISFENGVIQYIDFRNDTEPDDVEQVEVSSDKPAYLSNYVAPSALGADPFSGNFQLEDQVFTLPVPLQTMRDSGWTYDVEDEYVVGAGEGYVITLHKGDDLYMTTTVFNYDEKATYLKNTIVTSVTTNASSHFKNNMQLPGGLYAGMTEADFLKWLNANNIKNYEYSATTEIYKVPFDQTADPGYCANRYYVNISEGIVDSIDITNYGWLRQ